MLQLLQFCAACGARLAGVTIHPLLIHFLDTNVQRAPADDHGRSFHEMPDP
jgi:hypothetical protein